MQTTEKTNSSKYIWPFGPQRIVLNSFRAAIGKSAVLLPSSFVAATGMGILTLGLVFYLRDLFGAEANTIGLFSSLYNISYISGCFVLRPLSRKLLPRFSLILATLLMGLFAIMMIFAKSINLLFPLYCLYGFANSLFWPPLMGWLSAGIEGSALNKTISRWNFSWNLGNIISPYITGLLAEKNTILPLYTGIGLLFLVALLIGIASITFRNIRVDTHREIKVERGRSKEQDKSTYLRFPGWINLFSVYIILGIMGNIFPLYARDHIGITESQVGLVLLARSLFGAFGFIITGKTLFWHFKGRYIIGNQVILALLLLALIPLDSYAAYLLAMPVLGLVTAFIYSNAMFHGVSGSVERGKRMSIQESLLTSGFVFGSLAGGQLYYLYTLRQVYLFCLAVILSGLAIQLVLVGKNRKKREDKEG